MPGNLPAPHTNHLFPDVPDVPTTALFQGLTDHFDIYQPQSLCYDRRGQKNGIVAQLGERLNGITLMRASNSLRSSGVIRKQTV